jgi:hypothetical protein
MDSSSIRDTSHFAFPMSARALITRRDNLKATIAAFSISEQVLSRGAQASPQTVRRRNNTILQKD